MKNKILMFGFAILFALFAVSFVSAYNPYYNDGYFNDVSYSYVKNSGNYFGSVSTRAVDYNRQTDVRYLPYGGTETVTTYTKKVLDDPGFGHYQPRYYNYYPGSNYRSSYTPRYTYYNNYNPRVNRYQYYYAY